MTPEQLKNLRAIESEIRISAALDWEVTLGGNGINAYEAEGVINAVLDALELEHIEPTEVELAEAEERGYV